MKEYKFKINGKDYDVVINSIEGKNASVSVNGNSYDVELENSPAAPAAAPAATKAAEPSKAAPAAAPAAAPKTSGAEVEVKSPMEGNVIEVCANVGDSVKNGQKILVIEAMKMEVEISATKDGSVTGILVHKGDHLKENQTVATIA